MRTRKSIFGCTKRSRSWSTPQALAFYLLWGCLHEISHLVAATVVHGRLPFEINLLPIILLRAFLGRSCSIPPHYNDDSELGHIFVVRHAGWSTSVLVAACCLFYRHRLSREAVFSSVVTVVDALATDLFSIGVIRGVGPSTLFCGNFGVILLNSSAWTSVDQGKTALDLLQEMIRITMMRGAQSGGVVAWSTTGTDGELRGIRSRVVNGKRSDLSVRLRRRIDKDALTTFTRRLKPGIRAFLGHTRFATSSKATFDGTHPHRWTPPRSIRVFDVYSTDRSPCARVRRVETFVTHNGDLDFYKIGSVHASLEAIQQWLGQATGAPMPCLVDSAAIAGLMDILRSAGSIALSLRYALLLDSPHSAVEFKSAFPVPTWSEFAIVGEKLEASLLEFCKQNDVALDEVRSDATLRSELVETWSAQSEKAFKGTALASHISGRPIEEAAGTTSFQLMQTVVKAFFDHDLFESLRIFFRRASGSFGLMVTCSLDADRQVCIAAKGQSMSVGFFPRKGVICFGSEQAAVKAGLSFSSPVGDTLAQPGSELIDLGSFRLDLNDLSGEVCLLDWGVMRGVAIRDTRCRVYEAMDGNVEVTLYQPNRVSSDPSLFHRLISLEDKDLILPYPIGAERDPVLKDIKDIPRVCRSIQASWRKAGLNRLTAWNLSRRLRSRLQARVDGKIPSRGATVDILVTGTEVSLWVAEQFASDLQKAFPGLFVRSLSANKILGVFGQQELPTPATGHPVSKDIPDLHDTIVIIVSHSGGNFSPLACSSLLQSVTKNIFVVTSEWDTQIGKQLRTMFGDDDEIFSSRIFSTDIGIRPAEPCSLTVAATHQLLTNLFMHICMVVGEPRFRDLSGAIVTDHDLGILEKCNQDNITALEEIVGASRIGSPLDTRTEWELRESGRHWSKHVLEIAKSYMLVIAYIVVTVTSGYPLVTGVAVAAGINESGTGYYIARFFDSLIYLFLPQIGVILLRLLEGRSLLHRMVARTVIVGDCPWVAQSIEAYVSKLFARSYSIASLTMLSGNPTDHLLHRHTHRVVRGSLLVYGRPDGRLSALTSAEMAVVLAMSQTSSIQSLGSTCESITIGHNASSIALSAGDIFLDDHRSKFLCEQLLEEMNPEVDASRGSSGCAYHISNGRRRRATRGGSSLKWARDSRGTSKSDLSHSSELTSGSGPSSHTIKGRYMTMKRGSRRTSRKSLLGSFSSPVEKERRERADVKSIVADLTKSREELAFLRILFEEVDRDNDGRICADEFVTLYNDVRKSNKKERALRLFHEIDSNGTGTIDFDQFFRVARMADVEVERTLTSLNRDQRGLVQVKPNDEEYFGKSLRQVAHSIKDAYILSKTQHNAMELYESRIASLQRFCAMCVMFHEVGSRVEKFFRTVSFGLLGYQMDQTHSILRVTTTASPVSGADVRDRMERLRITNKVRNAVRTISTAWLRYEKRKTSEMKLSFRNSIKSPTTTQRRHMSSRSGEGEPSMLSQTRLEGISDV